MSKNKQKKDEHLYLMEERTFHRPNSKSLILVCVCLSVFFGVVSGIFGNKVFYDYFNKKVSYLNDLINSQSTEEKKVDDQDFLIPTLKVNLDYLNKVEEQIWTINEKAKNSVVDIYSLSVDKDKSNFLTNRVGTGFVLTTDGWIVSAGKLIIDKEYSIVYNHKEIYQVNKFFFDSATGLVFFKINRADLPVFPFAEKDYLRAGATVLSVNSVSGLSEAIIKKIDFWLGSDNKIQSSEKYTKLVLLGDNFFADLGAPVFDLNGVFLGIVTEQKDAQRLMMPVYYFSDILSNLYKKAEINRSVLGVNFIDLSQVISDKEFLTKFGLTSDKSFGAFLSGNEAVIKGSPAEICGLLPEDLLTKVNSEIISDKNDLSQLILDYQPLDKLLLTVIRQGKETILPCVLNQINQEVKIKK